MTTATKTWPRLFKRSSTGKDQRWDISVVPDGEVAVIRVEHGQVDGKIQTSDVRVTKGKNLGKKNATTALQQALSEAESKFKKQLDKGYSENLGGGSLEVKPMLAHSYEDDKDKVTFESAFVQPKLDGIRCIAHRVSEYDIRLFSRQGKPFDLETLTEILMTLRTYMQDGDIWDGELYVHGTPFQSVASWVKKRQPDSAKLQYHVYDFVGTKPFFERYCTLIERLTAHDVPATLWEDVDETHRPKVRLVPTHMVATHDAVMALHEQLVAKGYEGVMLRWGQESYKSGYRSHHLLKVKAWRDSDYEIVDVVDGKGKFEGRAIFVCKTPEGETFEAVPKGRDELRQQYFAERETLKGKRLKVRYFELTASEKPVPRFPIALGVREDFD